MKLVFPMWQSPRRLTFSGTKSESTSASLHEAAGPAAATGASSITMSRGEKHPLSRRYRAGPQEHERRRSQRRWKKRRTTASWTKRTHLRSRRKKVRPKGVMLRGWGWWRWWWTVEGQGWPSTRDGRGRGRRSYLGYSWWCFVLSLSLVLSPFLLSNLAFSNLPFVVVVAAEWYERDCVRRGTVDRL